MALIESQLEGLLLSHDCVIIPGLGGFVCNQRPARYDEQRHELFPPTRAFQFNERLVHHDGLLADALCRLGGYDYESAVVEIQEEVTTMQAALAGGKQVSLGHVGRLYRGEDHVLQFVPDRKMLRLLSAYGLERIPLRPIDRSILKPDDVTDTDSRQTIGWGYSLRRVAAILGLPLVIGAGYWAAAPHVEGLERMDLAGWIVPAPVDSDYLPRFTEEDVRLSDTHSKHSFATFAEAAGDATWLSFDFGAGLPSPKGTKVMLRTAELPSIPSVTSTEEPEHVAEIKDRFLIVVGAFGVEQNAHTMARELRNAGYTTSIHLQSNGLHIVASGSFEREDAARSHLNDVRAKGRKSAWLKRLS